MGGKVFVDLSVSLDGFTAGPDGDVERLHEWMFSGDTPAGGDRAASIHPGLEGFRTSANDAEVVAEMFRATGAVVMGRRWFDAGEEPWGEEPPFHVPVFVLTHRPRAPLVKGETTFTFVTDGVAPALERARAAARGRDVWVGAARTAEQVLAAGLLDEMRLHVVPVLLGAGTRLFLDVADERFRLERTRVIDSPAVTHLTYRVTDAPRR